jgi:dihydrofolate synthase / folylpolyglutamate synthase
MPDPRAEALALLTHRPKFGSGLGLQRMQAVMSGLAPALWSANGRALHVTGSQGKGTVTTLAAALLQTLGYKTGRYISPHLMAFEERIAINGAPLDAAGLAEAAARFAAREAAYLALHPNDRFGGFEAVTAAAFEAFAAADVDVAVLEAGIGGRFDATRAAHGSVVALTGIDREHAGLLGPTEEHILYDKADLCPAGGLLVAGRLEPELKRRLAAYGTMRGFDLLHAEEACRIGNIEHGADGALADFALGGLALDRLRTRVFGPAQLRNVAIAFLLVRAWLERKGAATGSAALGEAARHAFGETALPLRFERIGEDPVTIADVAHTPQASRALAETLGCVFPGERFVLLAGIADNRPAGSILEPLLALASSVICTRSHRGFAAELLKGALPRKPEPPVLAIEQPAEAFAEARRQARQNGHKLLVTGSLFLAAEAKCLAMGGDPAALEFL